MHFETGLANSMVPLTRKIDDSLEMLLPRRHDAESLFRVIDANRQHLRKWMWWVDKTQSPDDVEKWIDQVRQGFAVHGRGDFLLLEDGEIVGGIGNNADMHWEGAVEVGYWAAEHAQGRGIVSRACRALVQDMFASGVIHRVQIRAEAQNTRSWRVAERLGFTYEGMLRRVHWYNGRWVDHYLYAMLRDDWQASHHC
jgi:ribosomal-protein-serine acetyltransferase